MTFTLRRHRSILASALLLALSAAGSAGAADTAAELDARVVRSGAVFREMRSAPDHEIPGDLLARSRCVAVIPNVIKAAWVLGGRYGKGVLSCRSSKGEWSPPVFVMMTGGSFGLQIGASSTDVVLFFMTTDSVRSLFNNKVKLSGDLGVAAGPVGREAEAATDGAFQAQIYSYARSRGLFAGVSLSGAYLGVNYEDTRTYYGKTYTASAVLFDRKVTRLPKSTWMLLSALPKPSGSATAKAPAPKSRSTKSATASRKAPAKPAATAKPAKPASPPPAAVASVPPPAPGGGAEFGFDGSQFGEASGTAAGKASGSAAWGEASGTAAGEASGTAAAVAGEASGTAAAYAGEASGTAAYGEASGTAAALDNELGAGDASGTAARDAASGAPATPPR